MISLNELLSTSTRIVAFTGAGMSTESGIPDFRSIHGVWSKYSPVLFKDFIFNEESRQQHWRYKETTWHEFHKAQPNLGHKKLRVWHEKGLLKAVITQNIDGLHQASGLPDSAVIELHGSNAYIHCVESISGDCQYRVPSPAFYEKLKFNANWPLCPSCGGYLKPATVMFGQSMPGAAMAHAHFLAQNCDLFVVLGSSLEVSPANELPFAAKKYGAKLAVINREPTLADEIADCVVRGNIGEVLGPL